MTKMILSFLPTRSLTFDEAEAHYINIHSKFARRLFRAHGPQVLRYTINRALHQYDINGTFDQKPRAWRWVINEADTTHQSPEWVAPLVWRDHTYFLRDIVAGEVEPTTIVDRLTGQTSLVKYIFEYEKGRLSYADALDYYDAVHLPRLFEMVKTAFGCRLVISNRVVNQRLVIANEEQGQIIVPGELPEPRFVYRNEFYFDNADWGSEFFEQQEVRHLVNSSDLAISGYMTDEECGLDRR